MWNEGRWIGKEGEVLNQPVPAEITLVKRLCEKGDSEIFRGEDGEGRWADVIVHQGRLPPIINPPRNTGLIYILVRRGVLQFNSEVVWAVEVGAVVFEAPVPCTAVSTREIWIYDTEIHRSVPFCTLATVEGIDGRGL